MTGDLGAAPDTGADLDTTDPSDAGGSAVDGVDSQPANDNAAGETAAEKRIRLKYMGREEEIDDPRKLAERFTDDYEWEFTGPGGKPVKKRWPDIERDVQLSSGAQERMKQANAMRQQQQALIAWAKEDGFKNLPAALEHLFGVDDAFDIAEQLTFQRYQTRAQREAVAAQLAVNPDDPRLRQEFERLLAAESQAKHFRRQSWSEKWGQHQGQGQQVAAESQRREQVTRGELKNVGVKETPHTLARAEYIRRTAEREYGIQLEPRQVAHQLRKELDAEVLEHLDAMPVEKLLSYLGESRRAKLREAEVAATKAAQKAQRQAAPAKRAEPSSSNGKTPAKDVDSLRIKGMGGGMF